VLFGVLRLECDAASHVLNPGQSAHFDSDRPHRLGAQGRVAEVLLVAADTPSDMRRAHQYSE